MDTYTKIETNSSLLEKIASNYDKQSCEYKALKISAFAYGFSVSKHEDEFESYLAKMAQPLTKEEEEYLRKISE